MEPEKDGFQKESPFPGVHFSRGAFFGGVHGSYGLLYPWSLQLTLTAKKAKLSEGSTKGRKGKRPTSLPSIQASLHLSGYL